MLADMRHGEVRNYVYGVDLNAHYGMWQLAAEALWRTGGIQNESSYYATLSLNLHDWLDQSIIFLARYEEWHPNSSQSLVKTVPRFTIGLNYHINDYLYIKLEYLNTLGKMPEEVDFEKNAAKAQLVVNF
jgi:phosphate-selective porin